MATDYLLPLEGVKGESSARTAYPSLAALVADLHARSGGHLLTSVSHGARSPARQRTLDALRRLGVMERSAAADAAAAATAPAFIVLQAEGAAEGRSQPLPVLMVIADYGVQAHLLLPAVQKVREAASRMKLPAGARIAIGSGGPPQAAGRAKEDRDGWIELGGFSN